MSSGFFCRNRNEESDVLFLMPSGIKFQSFAPSELHETILANKDMHSINLHSRNYFGEQRHALY